MATEAIADRALGCLAMRSMAVKLDTLMGMAE